MVAVRMVSEGVDVPRLAVGVYATSASTPLFFAQAVGRFVRARRRGETASIFLPHVPQLLALAGEMERQRDHALDRDSTGDDEWALDEDAMDAAEREESASDALTYEFTYQALGSLAHFDRVLYDGREFGAARRARHPRGGGVPRASRAARARARARAAAAAPGAAEPPPASARGPRGYAGGTAAEPAPPQALHRTLKEQRQLLNSLVGLYARQTGDPHGMVHAELRRVCGGPAVSHATVAQLQARIDVLRSRVRS